MIEALTPLKHIFLNTPIWVWFVLAHLVHVGILATRRRVVYLPVLFLIPVILITLRHKMIFDIDLLPTYALWMLVGGLSGFLYAGRIPIQVLKNKGAVEVPGTYVTLVILLSFFAIKYVFGYLQAVHPDWATPYKLLEVAFTAVLSGFFLGRSVNYLRRYLKAQPV